MNSLERFAMFVIVLIVSACFDLLWAFPVMWCWNYAVTVIFDLPRISWLMSFCLLILVSYLKIVLIPSKEDY